MVIPLFPRTKCVIKSVLRPRWWIDVKEMAKKALAAVVDERIKIRPETAKYQVDV